MSIPEPTTALWVALRTYWDENIWPPADEAVIRDMGLAYQGLGEALTQTVEEGRRANGELPTYWRDVTGGIFHRNAGYTLEDLKASVQAYHDMAELCFTFAKDVARIRNAILAELAANAFAWGLTLAMPVAWALWHQLRILAGMVGRLSSVIRAAGSALRPIASAVPQSLLTGAKAVGTAVRRMLGEAAEEAAIDRLGQKFTIDQGYQKEYDNESTEISAKSGAVGVLVTRAISPLGRVGSAAANRLANMLRLSERGRVRAFLTQAGHGFMVNGVSSPVSSTGVQAAHNGTLHQLTWAQLGSAILNQGPLAGALAVSRFMSTHLGTAMGTPLADRIHAWGGHPPPTPTPAGPGDPNNSAPLSPTGKGGGQPGGQAVGGTGTGAGTGQPTTSDPAAAAPNTGVGQSGAGGQSSGAQSGGAQSSGAQSSGGQSNGAQSSGAPSAGGSSAGQTVGGQHSDTHASGARATDPGQHSTPPSSKVAQSNSAQPDQPTTQKQATPDQANPDQAATEQPWARDPEPQQTASDVRSDATSASGQPDVFGQSGQAAETIDVGSSQTSGTPENSSGAETMTRSPLDGVGGVAGGAQAPVATTIEALSTTPQAGGTSTSQPIGQAVDATAPQNTAGPHNTGAPQGSAAPQSTGSQHPASSRAAANRHTPTHEDSAAGLVSGAGEQSSINEAVADVTADRAAPAIRRPEQTGAVDGDQHQLGAATEDRPAVKNERSLQSPEADERQPIREDQPVSAGAGLLASAPVARAAVTAVPSDPAPPRRRVPRPVHTRASLPAQPASPASEPAPADEHGSTPVTPAPPPAHPPPVPPLNTPLSDAATSSEATAEGTDGSQHTSAGHSAHSGTEGPRGPIDPPDRPADPSQQGAGGNPWFDSSVPFGPSGTDPAGALEASTLFTYGRNEARWAVGEDGRIRRVNARLREDHSGGRRPRLAPLAGRIDGDSIGHYLARRFFRNDELYNLFPQNGTFNNVVYGDLEKEWAAWVAEGYEVEVDIIPAPGKARPDSLTVSYTVLDTSSGQDQVVWSSGRTFVNATGQSYHGYLAAQQLRALEEAGTTGLGANEITRTLGPDGVVDTVTAVVRTVDPRLSREKQVAGRTLAIRRGVPFDADGNALGHRLFGPGGVAHLAPPDVVIDPDGYARLEQEWIAQLAAGNEVTITARRLPTPGQAMDSLHLSITAAPRANPNGPTPGNPPTGPQPQDPTPSPPSTPAEPTTTPSPQAPERDPAPGTPAPPDAATARPDTTEAAASQDQAGPPAPEGEAVRPDAAGVDVPVDPVEAVAPEAEGGRPGSVEGPAPETGPAHRLERFLPGWVLVSYQSGKLLEDLGAVLDEADAASNDPRRLAVELDSVRHEGKGVYRIRTTTGESFRLIKRVGPLPAGTQVEYTVELDGVPTVDLMLSDRLTHDDIAPMLARVIADAAAIVRGDTDDTQVFRPTSTPEVDAVQRPIDAADRAELRQRGQVERNLPAADHVRRAAVREEIHKLVLSMGVVDGQPDAELLRSLLGRHELEVLDRLKDRWQDVGDDRVSRTAYLAKAVLGSGTSAVVIGAAAAIFTGDPLVGVAIAVPTIVNSLVGSLSERYLDAKKQPGKKPAYVAGYRQRAFDHPGLHGLLDGPEPVRPSSAKVPLATSWGNYLVRHTTPTLSAAAVAGALSLFGVPAWSTAVVIGFSALAKSLAERLIDIKKLEFRLRRVDATERIRLSDPAMYANQLVTEFAELRMRLDRALAAVDLGPDQRPETGDTGQPTGVTPVLPKVPGAPPLRVNLMAQGIDSVAAAARRIFVGGDLTQLARFDGLLNVFGPSLFGSVTGALGDKYFMNREEAANDARKQWGRTGQQAAQAEALAEFVEPRLREFRRLVDRFEALTGAPPDLADRAADRGLPRPGTRPDVPRPGGQAHWSAYAIQVAAAALGGAVSSVGLWLIFDLPEIGVVLTVAGGVAGVIGTPVARYLFRRAELGSQAALETNKASHAVDHGLLLEERAVTRYLIEQLSARATAITEGTVARPAAAPLLESEPHYTDHIRAAVRRAELEVVPPGRPESAHDLDARVERVQALERIDRLAADIDRLEARGVGGQLLDDARARLTFAIGLFESITTDDGVRLTFPAPGIADTVTGRRVTDLTSQVKLGVEQAVRRLVAEPAGKPLLAERLIALEQLTQAAIAVGHHAVHGTDASRSVVQQRFDHALQEASRLWQEAGVPNGLVLPALSVRPGLDRAGGQVVIPLRSVPPVVPAKTDQGGRHHRPDTAGEGVLQWNHTQINGARALFPADAAIDRDALAAVERGLAALVERGYQVEVTVDRVARPAPDADPYRFTVRITDPTLPTAVGTDTYGPSALSELATRLRPAAPGRHRVAEPAGRRALAESEDASSAVPRSQRARRRPPGGHTVGAPEIRGFTARGRPPEAPDLSLSEVMAAVAELEPSDFGGMVDSVSFAGPDTVVVETAAGPHHFRVKIEPVRPRHVATTTVRAGTKRRPHIVRISPRTANHHLARVWLHEISHTLQDLRGDGGHGIRGVPGRPAHPGHDACVAARFNEHRLLSRQWAEAAARAERTGQEQDRRHERRLRREIVGLAAAIIEQGHVAPQHPWAAKPSAGPATDPVDVTLPEAELIRAVEHELRALDDVISDLDVRIAAKQATAEAAAKAKEAADQKVEEEGNSKDEGRYVRVHEHETEAEKQGAAQARHLEVKKGYEAARNRIKLAQAAYRSILAEPAGQSTKLLAEKALEAADHVMLYRTTMAELGPQDLVLATGMVTGELPHLTALSAKVNQELRARGIDSRFTAEELRHELLAKFGRLITADGAVLRVGHEVTGELRVRLRTSELLEVLDPPVKSSQIINGQLPQGIRRIATAVTAKSGWFGEVATAKLIELFGQHSMAHAISTLVPVRAAVSVEQSRSVSASASEAALGGAVEDNRSESVLFSGRASWELAIRSDGGTWTPAGMVSVGNPDDTTDLRMHVSHAYTVAASKDPKRIDESKRDKKLPTHVPSAITGLEPLSRRVRAILAEHVATVDRVLADQVDNALMYDLPARLTDAAGPGIVRPLLIGGRPAAYLLIETQVGYEQAELVGTDSDEHWTEELRVGFSQASGDQSFGRSSSVTGAVGYGGEALTDIDDTRIDLGPEAQASWTAARSAGLSGGGTAIQVGVHRYTGPTQGYRMVLDHTVTVVIGNKTAGTVKGSSEALLRFRANDAYRYGLPVDESTLVHDDTGRPVIENGRRVLRGDPRMTEKIPGRKLVLPGFVGDGPGQLRGTGPFAVQQVTGADQALQNVVRYLSERGFLPPLDKNDEPDLGQLSTDPLERHGQLLNLDEVRHQLSAPRLETGYDIAVQDGLLFAVVRPGLGRGADTELLRIDIKPNYDAVSSRGVTTDEPGVGLTIGSNTTSASTGLSRSLPWLAKLPFGAKPDRAEGGVGGKAEVSYSGLLARVLSWATSSTANIVWLQESGPRVLALDVPHTVTITALINGQEVPVGDPTTGSARVLVDGGLLPYADPSLDPATTPGKAVSGKLGSRVLDRATIIAADTGKLLARIPAALRSDPAALLHLSAFLNSRSVMAHPEWTQTPYRTRVAVRGGALPREAQVSLTGSIHDAQFVAVRYGVLGRIMLLLSSHSASHGSSRGKGWLTRLAGVGAGDPAGGGNIGGGRSSSWSRSFNALRIWGRESLAIFVGQQYVFTARAEFTLETADGSVTGNEQGADLSESGPVTGAVMFEIPEPDALQLYTEGELALPLSVVADAVERFTTGKATWDRRLSLQLIRQYRTDLEAATKAGRSLPALSHGHTADKLAEAIAKFIAPRPRRGVGTDNEKLHAAVKHAEAFLKATEEVALPEHYEALQAASLVDSVELQDGDRPARLLDTVAAAVADITGFPPEQDPVLAESLFVDLAGKRWWGRLDDMLGPNGFVRGYSLTSPGGGPEQKITVRIKARFSGSYKNLGVVKSVIGIIQAYLYGEWSRTASTGLSVTGSGGLDTGHGGSSTAGTDRAGGTSVTSSDQLTRLERLAMFGGMARIMRNLQVEVEVSRDLPGTAGAARRRLDASGAASADQPNDGGQDGDAGTPRPGHRTLSGDIVQYVAAELVTSNLQAAAAAAEAASNIPADHRRATLPSSYAVEGTIPFRPGDPIGDALFEAVVERLAQPDMVHPVGARMHRTELENAFSTSGRDAAFSQMATPTGTRIIPLAVPGSAKEVVDVTVRAAVSDVRLVVGPIPGREIGEVNRSQWMTSISVLLGRLLPFNGGLSTGGDEGSQLRSWGLGGGATAGEQVRDQFFDGYGARVERSRFERSDIVTVRVRVDYDVMLERKELLPKGGAKSITVAQLPGAATGEAYLTMFKHEYDAMLARMDQGDTVAAAWGHATGTGRKSLSVTASVDPAKPSAVLTDALRQARKDKAEVLLTVTEPDGRKRSYLALPDGTLHGDAADDGFAESFATVHPRLVELADEHGIDLRALYDAQGTTPTFTATVLTALTARRITVEVHPSSFPAVAADGGPSVAGTTHAGAGGVAASAGGSASGP